MNNTEAKFILSAYRPDGSDAADATFCAALAQAKADPALARWFELEQRFDRAMCAKLGEIVPPAGLREAILAGARVSAGPTASRAWWRQQGWMAAAAGLAVFFAAGMLLWPGRAEAHGSLPEFVVADAQLSMGHGLEGGHHPDFESLFKPADMRLGRPVAMDFEALRRAGCRSISFAGKPVLEVCFERDGMWFHCYVVRRSDFPALGADSAPRIAQSGPSHIAQWADDDHVYLVVSKSGREALQRLI